MLSRRSFLAISLSALALPALAGKDPNYDPMPEFLYAIAVVESNVGAYTLFNDGGSLAYGPFCIHETYWRDAVNFDPSLRVRKNKPTTIWNCYGRKEYSPEGGYQYSAKVIDAYMRKYAALAYYADPVTAYNKWQVMARVHNGGPKGNSKAATLPYWEKVKKVLLKRGWRTAPKGGIRPPQT
jgi:hypothetical protein